MNKKNSLYIVQIIEDKTGNVAWASEPHSQREADKIEEGAGINLDWDHYHIETVEVKNEGE